ncbi:histidine phosphatase superfamily [Mycena belliarum]|uniref:Histidine phosphatase superfamily n=1 Tax=Mycena belliarum TaxID=1033014 RepID=A0AAD6U477_9AGAR|nr:histidine phosphatase superfamily [Mycena belliae]
MFSYQAVPGYFAQDDLGVNPVAIGPVPARFGLLDASEARWINLIAKLRELNANTDNVSYKLIFLGRHGQGFHNLAIEKYGDDAWEHYWSRLNGDAESTWGPDPELTALGIEQAASVNEVWKAELRANIPLPDRMYCSPMTRALHTNAITFAGVSSSRAMVLENCREIYGVLTCDKRRTRTYIRDTFPQFDIDGGLAEEDELWEAESRETLKHATARASAVLDRIFLHDTGAVFISITAHAGIIYGFLRALGRPYYPLPTGGTTDSVLCTWAPPNQRQGYCPLL